jgi:NAD(P)-dependent dehydrogenase (short-subunit alcohol dehydrogenase family)
MSLQGKTIVITGTSSGIGAEVAKLARFQGAKVIGVDRNDPSLTLDGFVKADLGTTAGIDAAVAQLPAQFDALCNVAGVPGTAAGDVVANVNYLGLRHLSHHTSRMHIDTTVLEHGQRDYGQRRGARHAAAHRRRDFVPWY